MRRYFTILLLAALALALFAAGSASASPRRCPVGTPQTVATFSPGDFGSFAESMAADSHGDLWVSLTTWGLYETDDEGNVITAESNVGEIWKVRPDGVKTLAASADLSPWGMLGGVAVDRCDRVYVVTYDMESGLTANGVYRVDRDGSLTQVVALPEGVWPNGLAFHGRYLYITDSAKGTVWRVQLGCTMASPTEPWLQNDRLLPGDAGIGANGIAFRGDQAFVAVSAFGRIVRIPVKANGSAGKPVVVAEDARLTTADGIAFDIFGGLWITTNSGTTDASPSGGLYRLAMTGGIWTVADNPGWLNYPAMPVFGRTLRTATTLFIENGAYYSAFGDGTAPDIQALRVGIPGLPLW